MSVTGDVRDLNFTSLHFNYSSVSRRSLGDISPPINLNIFRSQDLDAIQPGHFVLDDVVVRYSDGPALLISGAGSLLQDCAFEWNDWMAVGGERPNDWHSEKKVNRGMTVRTWGGGFTFRRLTFSNNGAAQALSALTYNGWAPSLIEMCNFNGQFGLQDDGAFVEGVGTPSSSLVRNWFTNSGRQAMRWDKHYPYTSGGTLYENVVWNTSFLKIKGDNHNVSHNTVFDGADITPDHAAHDRPRYQDHSSNLSSSTLSAKIGVCNGASKYDPRANNKSVFERNIFDSWGTTLDSCDGKPCMVPGQHRDNLIGTEALFDIRDELRDPFHLDFRPCPGSQAARLGAGAHLTYSLSADSYWIPGRRERTSASTPVPPTGSIQVHRDTELMFLPAAFATGHYVYFAKTGDDLTLLCELNGSDRNIVRLPSLDAHTEYHWRVDTRVGESDVILGLVWSFTTGESQASCTISSDEVQAVV